MNLHQAKQDIIEVGRRLYQKEFVASNDGNISARIAEDRIVTTPTGLCKGTLALEDLCVVDLEGNHISGQRRASSEVGMHLFLYSERPDINAVVHAHPPTATGFSVAGIPLTVGFIAKFYVFMAGVESGLWALLATLVIGSGIGLYYYLRIVYRMLTQATDKTPLPFSGVESLSSHSVLAILFVLLLVLGVFPAPVMAIIETISAFI